MKLDITCDLQSSNVLELSDTDLAVVSGGRDRDDRRWFRDRDDRRWFRRRDYSDWQNSDCFGGYNSQPQIIYVEQQSAPCVVIPSSCY